jgi:hypothetical protein
MWRHNVRSAAIQLLFLVYLAAAQHIPGCSCSKYSANKIDYHDADVVPVIDNIHNETACCDACTAHNAARHVDAPASTNCTIAVWHGPGHYTCNLKASAKQPFASTAVVAIQPQVVPPTPAPRPLRFASIYTDHMVLQSAPAQASVWGFVNVAAGEKLTLVASSKAGSQSAVVTLSTVPSNTKQAGMYKHIWSALLPAMKASFDQHTLTVASSSGLNATVTDVLYGDVWVCSGQSKYSLLYGVRIASR